MMPMSSRSPMRRAARRLAPSLALVLAAGCMPPAASPQFSRYSLVNDPDPVTTSLLMRMTAQQEAEVLKGLAPVIPPLVRRVWGVPTGEPWRLEVLMTPWRLTPEGGMSYWVDLADDATARDRARYAFRQALEEELAPPAPSRAWYVGASRGVSVQQARTSGDSLIVLVDVSAGMRCPDGRDVVNAIGYDIAFVRQPKGGLRLAEQPPRFVAKGNGTKDGAPAASCAPKPLVAAGN